MITKQELIDLWTKGGFSKVESRIRSGEPFADDMPNNAVHYVTEWAYAEPGEDARKFAHLVKEALGLTKEAPEKESPKKVKIRIALYKTQYAIVILEDKGNVPGYTRISEFVEVEFTELPKENKAEKFDEINKVIKGEIDACMSRIKFLKKERAKYE